MRSCRPDWIICVASKQLCVLLCFLLFFSSSFPCSVFFLLSFLGLFFLHFLSKKKKNSEEGTCQGDEVTKHKTQTNRTPIFQTCSPDLLLPSLFHQDQASWLSPVTSLTPIAVRSAPGCPRTGGPGAGHFSSRASPGKEPAEGCAGGRRRNPCSCGSRPPDSGHAGRNLLRYRVEEHRTRGLDIAV